MASEEYKESEAAKLVKKLMDEEGFEFGEAVREAIRQTKNFESKADGGSIGIEVLFTEKKKNGGRIGFDNGGQTAPAGTFTLTDYVNFLNTAGDFNRLFDKGEKLVGEAGEFVEQIGDKEYDDYTGKELIRERELEGQLENLEDEFAKTEDDYYDRARDIPADEEAMGAYARQLINDLNQRNVTLDTLAEIAGLKKGGRVGLFMGGPPLEGQALAIYNSMNVGGATDQEIADRLSSLGLYTPGGNTTPPSEGIIGAQLNQGGGDKPMIQPFRQDPRVGAAFEAYQRNQGLKALGIEDPFADEISLEGAYYGDMPNVNLQPGSQTFMGKIKSQLGQIAGVSPTFNFLKAAVRGINNLLPVNQRGIAENVAGNMGIRVDDIGRIVNTGDYQDPNNVMAGYNLNKMTDETFDKRIDTISGTLSEKYGLSAPQIQGILEGTLSDEELADINARAIMPGTNKTTNLIKQLRSINIAKDKNKFIQDIAQKEAEKQRIEKERKKAFAQAERDRKKYAGIEAAISRGDKVDDRDRPTSGPTAVAAGMGVGGGYASDFGFLKDGGLATMFKPRRR